MAIGEPRVASPIALASLSEAFSVLLHSALLALLNTHDALASLLEAKLASLSGALALALSKGSLASLLEAKFVPLSCALALALSEGSLTSLSACTTLASLAKVSLMGALALTSLKRRALTSRPWVARASSLEAKGEEFL